MTRSWLISRFNSRGARAVLDRGEPAETEGEADDTGSFSVRPKEEKVG